MYPGFSSMLYNSTTIGSMDHFNTSRHTPWQSSDPLETLTRYPTWPPLQSAIEGLSPQPVCTGISSTRPRAVPYFTTRGFEIAMRDIQTTAEMPGMISRLTHELTYMPISSSAYGSADKLPLSARLSIGPRDRTPRSRPGAKGCRQFLGGTFSGTSEWAAMDASRNTRQQMAPAI